MAWNPAWANAIASIESQGSGGYSAVGPQTAKGNRAYGKYQVMDFNIPAWTQKHLGQKLTPEQFLASPEAQEAVFQGEFGASVQKYGNPQDAASVWFTGRPASQGAGSSDILGTTGAEYVNKFNSALGQGMTTSTKGPQMMQEEKPRGLMGSLGIQKMEEGAAGETGQRFYNRDSFKDAKAILAQGFGRMGIMGMDEIADNIAKQRTENKARNKTAEYLDKYMPGAGDLVREGYFSAKDALSISMDKQSRELAQQAAAALRAGNNQEAMAILTQLSPTAMGQQLATQMKPRDSEVIGGGRYTVTYDQDGNPQISLNTEVIAAEQQIEAAKKLSAPLPRDARKSEEEDFAAIEAYDNLIQDIGGIASQFGYNPETNDFEGALRIGLDGLIKGGLGAIGLGRENVETAKARQQFDRFKTRLINESLRLNKGVQTEGDAQRAARELGDAKTEATAYAAIQELLRINQRARANKVSAIERRRGRFGVEGIEIPAAAAPANIGWKVIDG